MVKGYMQQ
jgi:hypothetical protein